MRHFRTCAITRHKTVDTHRVSVIYSDKVYHEETPIAPEVAFRFEKHPVLRSSSLRQSIRIPTVRITGDHHIYVHPEAPELVNLQNIDGKAKPYQVKQLLQIIERYNLRMEDEE